MTADRRTSVQDWFPLAQLAWVAAAGAMWYLFPGLGALPLLVAPLPWLSRLVGTGRLGRRTPFDVPLLVFLITAAVSLWAAYDPDGSRAVFAIPVGRRKLWGLILSTLVYYSVTEFRTDNQRRWLLSLLAGFGTAVALWFLATNDWNATPALWGPLTRLGEALQSVLPPVPGHRLSPNVAGGLIALVLPMALELTTRVRRARVQGKDRGGPAAIVWSALAAGLMALGLVLSSSRGAWLGVGGALGLAAAWWLAGSLSGKLHRSVVFTALVTAAALLAILGLTRIPFLRLAILESEALANRLSISYQAAHLVRDYMFTGCGLGNFPFVHSTYVLLIHVPEMVFAHCTPLDVAVEQGMFGAMALVAVWIGAAWMGMRQLAQSDESPTGLTAGLLSLVVLMVHGAFDSTIYGSRALLLLWMPPGLIVAATARRRGDTVQRESQSAGSSSYSLSTPDEVGTPDEVDTSDEVGRPNEAGWANQQRRRNSLGPLSQWRVWAPVMAAALALVALLALLWRPLAASWYANLGAVHQTLVELHVYDHAHFDDPTLDQVRQRVDLSEAVEAFERALTLDPTQVTARNRLSQIALARRDYDGALEHAQAAWDAGYRDRVTRLVLGDALVAKGRVEEAAQVVRGLERAQSRLEGQASYKYQQHGDWQRAAYAWRTVLALDPGNQRARSAAERAEAEATGE